MTDSWDRMTYRADIDTPGGLAYEKSLLPKLSEREVAPLDSANLISSELSEECSPASRNGHWPPSGLHCPVLDIDFEARLIPSSTPGHFHLYLDGLVLDWPSYRRLLDALAVAGVIQEGYANASIERKATYVRKPGVKKGDGLPPLPAWAGAKQDFPADEPF